MSLPNGVHHLPLATRDVGARLDFFTEVIGMELVALHWIHGVENTVDALVKMGETATIAFVRAPEMKDVEPASAFRIPASSRATSRQAPCSTWR